MVDTIVTRLSLLISIELGLHKYMENSVPLDKEHTFNVNGHHAMVPLPKYVCATVPIHWSVLMSIHIAIICTQSVLVAHTYLSSTVGTVVN